jgi:O-antigen/teichoic acid export membrane protein
VSIRALDCCTLQFKINIFDLTDNARDDFALCRGKILWFDEPFTRFRNRAFWRSAFHFNWAIVDQSLVSGANFATSILLARTMGVAAFGAYVLAWMVVNFTQTIQHSAINTVMLTIGPKLEKAARADHDSLMFLQQGVFGIVTALLSWLVVHLSNIARPDWHLEALALPLAFAVLFCQAQDFFRRYLFSIQRPRVAFLMDFVRYVGPIGLLFLYIQWEPGITAAAVIWIISLSAALAVMCVVYFVPKLTWSRSTLWSAIQNSWQFSRWLVGSTLLSWTMGNLYYLATAILLGTSATGYLRVGHTLMAVTNIVFLGIENVLPIQSSQKYVEGGITALNRYLTMVAVLGSIAIAIVDGFFFIFPEPALIFFFGSSYSPAAPVVQWAAVGQVVAFLTVPAMVWLRTVEQTKRIFYAYVASSVASVLIAYPAISYFGIIGAASGLFIVIIVNCAALAWGIRISLRIRGIERARNREEKVAPMDQFQIVANE